MTWHNWKTASQTSVKNLIQSMTGNDIYIGCQYKFEECYSFVIIPHRCDVFISCLCCSSVSCFFFFFFTILKNSSVADLSFRFWQSKHLTLISDHLFPLMETKRRNEPQLGGPFHISSSSSSCTLFITAMCNTPCDNRSWWNYILHSLVYW